MRLRLRRRRRDEGGVVAVLVAISCTLLLCVAALAVDMGNAWTQRREVQTEADLAALAGGALLPAKDAVTKTAVAVKVLEYLKRNDTYGQDDGDSASWTAAQLLDGTTSNGEITFPTPTRLQVLSPPSTVKFGLGRVMAPPCHFPKRRNIRLLPRTGGGRRCCVARASQQPPSKL